MTGLAIWAHDVCRSTLGFYLELGKVYAIPFKVFIVHRVKESNRDKVGFKQDELYSANITFLDDNETAALTELNAHKNWYHLFASYQKKDIFQVIINYAIANHVSYGIMSEAPCNMEPLLLRRGLKEAYLKWVLPHKLSGIIHHADFIVNYSGYYENALQRIGWAKEKIVSFGYYPPPIPGSRLIKRTVSNWNNFTILLSGLHQWHRSPMTLLKALSILDKRNIPYHCYITQEGPLLKRMQHYAKSHNLTDVEFLGFVSMERLVELYETCSVYVGTGGAEPWGMRLNDALQCGAPLVISRGMGGVKLIDEFDCGLSFAKNDYHELAQCLERMITDSEFYLKSADNAFNAAKLISPKAQAQKLHDTLQNGTERISF